VQPVGVDEQRSVQAQAAQLEQLAQRWRLRVEQLRRNRPPMPQPLQMFVGRQAGEPQ
jgi:hypothetical protein